MLWKFVSLFSCALFGMFRNVLVEPLVCVVDRVIDGCVRLEGSFLVQVVGDVLSQLLTCFCIVSSVLESLMNMWMNFCISLVWILDVVFGFLVDLVEWIFNFFWDKGKFLLLCVFSLLAGVGFLVIIVMFVDVLQPWLMLQIQPFVLGSEKSYTSFIAVAILGVFWTIMLVSQLVFLLFPLFIVWTYLFGMSCIAYFYIDSHYRTPKGIEPYRWLKCMVREWEWYRPWFNMGCGLVRTSRLMCALIYFHCFNLRVWKWRLLYLRYLAFPYIERSRPWVQTNPEWLVTL